MSRKIYVGIVAAVAAAAVGTWLFVIKSPDEAEVPVQTGVRRVGLVPPGTTSPFHAAIAEGAEDAAADLGWKIDVVAPDSEGDFAGQAVLVKKLLDEGAEAISINPIQEGAIIPVVREANSKGVPVFLHNFTSPFTGGDITAYIGYDQWAGAEKLGRYACELIAKKNGTTPEAAVGKVFILKGIEGMHAHRRTQGFRAGLALCPQVVIVGEQTADWLRTKAMDVAIAALQKNPDIDVFYGNSDEMGIGAALAAEKLGLVVNKDLFAVAIDGNKPTLDLIREGKFTATLGVDPARMGRTVVETMKKVLAGESVPQVVMTPSAVVTADNLASYEAGDTWSEPVAGLLEYDNGKPTVE